MATGSPVGVVTISISRWSFFNGASNTFIEKAEVPTEMFPVRFRTLLVPTIPVPASPSGGAIKLPACKVPLGSSNFAPSAVK